MTVAPSVDSSANTATRDRLFNLINLPPQAFPASRRFPVYCSNRRIIQSLWGRNEVSGLADCNGAGRLDCRGARTSFVCHVRPDPEGDAEGYGYRIPVDESSCLHSPGRTRCGWQG